MEDGNAVLQDAIAYRLVIIGEASASLLRKYPEFCRLHPEIPWASARAMRNFVVHEYMNLCLDRVWETAATSIPQLATLLAALLDSLNPEREDHQ